MIDEILILLIAGHETTANALSWALYLLASHPAEQDKLRMLTRGLSVAQSVVNDHLNCVINETMRLYPPAWISDRVSLEDDHYLNFKIPRDVIVILFYYGLHRDERYWEQPATFRPERFMRYRSSKEKPRAFYPFGAGPRMCIGNNFAMAEMTIFLQAFLERFQIFPGNREPEMKPLVTLRPDRVLLEIRRCNHVSGTSHQ